MSVSKQEVIDTAKLARLSFNDQEIIQLQASMSKILEMFDDLSAVNTEQVKHLEILPSIKLENLPATNPADKTIHTKEFAIEFANNEFLVPKVIDEE